MSTVVANLSILSVIFFAIIYLCIWTQPIFKSLISIQTNPSPPSYLSVPTDELEAALSRASMVNKTVIITVLNKAYAESHDDTYPSMLDLFLESFWLGEETRTLIDHLLFVAVDQTAYDRCEFRRLHCYKLGTEGADFTGEKVYMSDEFIKMMWRRTLFLLDVLKRGYNFIFTDTDIMWLRNPFPRLMTNRTEDDLQISTDVFDSPFSKDLINTGFYYIRANNKTISLFETWYAMKDNSTGMKEQDVLVRLRNKGVFGRLRLRVRILDTLYFNGFCSKRKDIQAVTTVHANCCRSISAKVSDLMAILRGWKDFKASAVGEATTAANNGTQSFRWMSEHFACWKSWDQPNKPLV